MNENPDHGGQHVAFVAHDAFVRALDRAASERGETRSHLARKLLAEQLRNLRFLQPSDPVTSIMRGSAWCEAAMPCHPVTSLDDPQMIKATLASIATDDHIDPEIAAEIVAETKLENRGHPVNELPGTIFRRLGDDLQHFLALPEDTKVTPDQVRGRADDLVRVAAAVPTPAAAAELILETTAPSKRWTR